MTREKFSELIDAIVRDSGLDACMEDIQRDALIYGRTGTLTVERYGNGQIRCLYERVTMVPPSGRTARKVADRSVFDLLASQAVRTTETRKRRKRSRAA